MSYLLPQYLNQRQHGRFWWREKLSKVKCGVESSQHSTPVCGRKKLLNEYRAGVVFHWTSWGHKGMAAFQRGHTGNVFGVVHVVEQVLHKKMHCKSDGSVLQP